MFYYQTDGQRLAGPVVQQTLLQGLQGQGGNIQQQTRPLLHQQIVQHVSPQPQQQTQSIGACTSKLWFIHLCFWWFRTRNCCAYVVTSTFLQHNALMSYKKRLHSETSDTFPLCDISTYYPPQNGRVPTATTRLIKTPTHTTTLFGRPLGPPGILCCLPQECWFARSEMIGTNPSTTTSILLVRQWP